MLINEDFEIKNDGNQWILIQYIAGTSKKTGLPIKSKSQTYHGRLSQACDSLLDKSLKKCESVEEVKKQIKRTELDILAAIKGI